MQVAIWILSILGVIGVGIGLGYLIYYLFWRVYGGKREVLVTRSEFEEFKTAIETKLEEGLINPGELDMLKKAVKAEEARKSEESVARSEFEEFKTAIEAKLGEEYVTISQFASFRDSMKKAM